MHTIEPTADTSRRFQCCHIFPDGHRCGSPALRQEQFCYYHHTSRAAARNRLSHSLPNLPEPHDLTTRPGIQLAIAEVLRRIALGDIDQRHAGLLLYGLQVASTNLPRDARDPNPEPTIEELDLHPTHGPIALPAEYIDPSERAGSGKSALQIFEEMERELDRAAAAENAQDVPPSLPSASSNTLHPYPHHVRE